MNSALVLMKRDSLHVFFAFYNYISLCENKPAFNKKELNSLTVGYIMCFTS